MLIVKQPRRIIPIRAQYSLLTFRNLVYVQASCCTRVYDVSFIVFRRYTNLHGSNVTKFFQRLLHCSAQRPQWGLNGTVNNALFRSVHGALIQTSAFQRRLPWAPENYICYVIITYRHKSFHININVPYSAFQLLEDNLFYK